MKFTASLTRETVNMVRTSVTVLGRLTPSVNSVHKVDSNVLRLP